jgi:hypothetical protein
MVYPESGFAIQLCKGEDTLTIATYDMDRLRSVASACRRLRDIACTSFGFTLLRLFFNCLVRNSTKVGSYRWLEPYALHPASWLSGTLLFS